MILGSLIAARLRLRVDAKYLIAAGISGISFSLLLISRLAVDSPYVAFAAVLAFMSLGMGLAMAPATDLIMGAVDKARAGVGSATNDATRELGSAMGVAVFGSIVSSGYRDVLAGPVAGLPGGVASLQPAVSGAVRDSIGSATVAVGSLPSETAAAVLSAARQAFVSGMSTAALVAAAVSAAGAITVLLWMPGRAPVALEEAEAVLPATARAREGAAN